MEKPNNNMINGDDDIIIEDGVKIIVNPYNFNNELITENDVKSILDKYGIENTIHNLDIYQKAFIHKSYSRKDPKVLGENVIKENVDDYIIFRMGTVYGWSPRMRFDLGINLFIEKSLWGETIQVFGGNQWRPLTHVKDASRALVMGVEKSELNTTLNLVGENHLILDIAKKISNDVEIVDYKDDNRSYKVENSRILNELEWTPKMEVLSAKDEFKKVEYQKDIFYNKRWDYS